MPYDENSVQRLRQAFSGRARTAEKRMFGGLTFMVRGNMCCGVIADRLMARVGPVQYEAALARAHAREMDFTGKPMKGYVFVAPEGYAQDSDLEFWVSACLAFNSTLPEK